MNQTPNPAPNKPQREIFLRAFSLAAEFGFIIALPLIVLGLAGKYLDNHLHKSYFTLIGILLALGFSTYSLYKRFQQLIKEMKSK